MTASDRKMTRLAVKIAVVTAAMTVVEGEIVAAVVR